MEDNKKSINWKSVLIVATFFLLIFCLAKINEQTEKMDTLYSFHITDGYVHKNCYEHCALV